MHKVYLILTVGLPRSGKSSWAEATGVPIVCPDSIRLALHGQRYAALAEPFVWAIARVMVKALFLSGHKAVIVDATHNSRKRRDFWRDKAEWVTLCRVFNAGKDECVERAKRTGRNEIVPVIERMASEHEPLAEDEKATLWPECGART